MHFSQLTGPRSLPLSIKKDTPETNFFNVKQSHNCIFDGGGGDLGKQEGHAVCCSCIAPLPFHSSYHRTRYLHCPNSNHLQLKCGLQGAIFRQNRSVLP